MLIFKVAQNSHIPDSIDGLLESAGVVVCNIDASSFSFLTSMRIATEYKKHKPDAVVVFRKKDAIGVISARSIVKGKANEAPYPIIFYISEKTELPRSLTTNLQKGVDVWAFDSEISRKKWAHLLKDTNRGIVVIPVPGENTPLKPRQAANPKPVLLYPGEIGKGENLAAIIKAIDAKQLTDKLAVRVLGTANARYVMPLVKRARANNIDITWTGNEFDLENELSSADGFIQSTSAPTGAELRLMANGIPAVDAANLEKWLGTENRTEMQTAAKQTYQQDFTPQLFVERVKNLLTELRQ